MWPTLLLSTAAYADPIEDYCAIPRALYAWNCATGGSRDGQSTWWHLLHDTNGCADKLLALAEAHRFERVYLFIGAVEWHHEGWFAAGTLPEEDAVAALTARLRAAGVEPWALWYLNDHPDDLDGTAGVVELVEAVAAFNARHPEAAFAGLHGDQEPNDRGAYAAYLQMNAQGLAAAEAAGLGWSAAIKPRWLSDDWEGAPFVEAILPGLSETTLMDYTDRIERALAQGEQFLAAADAAGISGEIAVETGWGDPTPGVSLGPLLSEDPEAFYAFLAELDGTLSAHPSYAGIAIHDHAQFFAGLYGAEPYDFAGEPGVLCSPESQDPDSGSEPDSSGEPGSGGRSEAKGGCGGRAALLGMLLWCVVGSSSKATDLRGYQSR